MIIDAEKVKLFACAHCGGEATIKDRGRSTIGHGESSHEYSLGCHKPKCMVQVSVGGRDDHEILTSLVDGIQAWNTRMA